MKFARSCIWWCILLWSPSVFAIGEEVEDEAIKKDDLVEHGPETESEDSKGGKSKVKVDGYIQVHYRGAVKTGDDDRTDNDNFRVQRVRIGVKGRIMPKIHYEIEFDPRAPEITGILRDAYIEFRKFIPKHRIRVGQQKTQFGFENRESSTKLFAVNRAEMSDALGRGINLRDNGVGLIGHVPISDDLRLEDAITITNGNGLNVQDDNTARKNLWGRIGLRNGQDASWIGFGLSLGTGDIKPPDPVEPKVIFKRYGADVEWENKYFFFSTEYAIGIDDVQELKVDGNLIQEEEQIDLSGFYASFAGKTSWDIGPILRFDSVSESERETYRRWTLGAYYGDRKADFRVMFNYEYRDLMEQSGNGKLGRGDDKYYLWTQVKL